MSSQGNPLIPPSAALPPSGVPAGQGPGGAPVDMNDLLNHMHGIHQGASAQYDKIQEAVAKADAIRMQMDELTKLGDMVTQEDLVKAASKLVGKGLSPAELAGILSEAPEGGEALKGWVMQQDQMLTANELKLKQLAATTRHDMGVSALRLIGAHQMAAAQGAGPSAQAPTMQPPGPSSPPTEGAANDLMPDTQETPQ